MRYVFCDVETGGLDPKVHGITEIGAIAFDMDPMNPFKGCIGDEVRLLVRPNPNLAYTPYALQLQDRTLQYLEEYGVTELEAWTALDVFLQQHLNRWQGHIVAHSAEFDRSFLSALAERCGKPEALPARARCSWICTKNLFRILSGLGIVSSSSCGLEDIMREYDIWYEGKQHEALTDARAGIQIFRHMVNDIKEYYGGK